MTLALAVMAVVLNSYTLLARNFTRSLGITSASQPNLEAQSRNTIATFTQDAAAAVSIQGVPSANAVTFSVPTSTDTNTIAYYYNSTAAVATATLAGYSKSVPANSLVRVDGNTGIMLVLHSGLLSLNFRYYDLSDNLYTAFNYATSGFSSFLGIKQVSLAFTCQGGSAVNGTLTQVYTAGSPRLMLHNKTLLQ
jgi:hypothetical protein